MTQIWHAGQETNSNVSGHEWDTLTGTGGSSVASPTHGNTAFGQRAWRALHAVNAITHHQHQFGAAGNTGTDWFFFVAFRWATLPGATCEFYQIQQAVTPIHSLHLTTGGVLQLFRNDLASQVGSDGPTLSTGVWYWGGIWYVPSSGAISVYLTQEGGPLVQVISGTTATTQSSVRVRAGIITSTTGEVVFDEHVINNSAGTTNNVIPQETYITSLRPNAAGDFNEASAGSFADIDEITPDDGVTIAVLDANGDRLDVNVDAVATPTTRINVINQFAGIWFRSAALSASAESWRRRFKTQASGTLLEDGANISHNDTTYKTNGDTLPLLPLVAESDPQNSQPLSMERFADAQIGMRAVDAAPDINVTQGWLYVAWQYAAVQLNPPVIDSPNFLGLNPTPLLKVA